MNFLKSKTAMIVFAACVAGAAVGLLIYGISTHTEPGFMARTPNWSRVDFPLALCAGSHTGSLSDHDDEAVNHAVSTINDRLGFTAFYRTDSSDVVLPDGPNCVVRLALGVPAEPGWVDPGGTAHIMEKACSAVVSNTSGELVTLVVQHELGHCLGLDHDDYSLSIMRRVQRDTPDGAFPPRISDSDRDLLREAYGPQ